MYRVSVFTLGTTLILLASHTHTQRARARFLLPLFPRLLPLSLGLPRYFLLSTLQLAVFLCIVSLSSYLSLFSYLLTRPSLSLSLSSPLLSSLRARARVTFTRTHVWPHSRNHHHQLHLLLHHYHHQHHRYNHHQHRTIRSYNNSRARVCVPSRRFSAQQNHQPPRETNRSPCPVACCAAAARRE